MSEFQADDINQTYLLLIAVLLYSGNIITNTNKIKEIPIKQPTNNLAIKNDTPENNVTTFSSVYIFTVSRPIGFTEYLYT